MQTLKFLGRGSAFNREEGNTSAYIKTKNSFFLIDCGELIYDEIEKRSLIDKNIKNINIAITHLHGDHAGSLSSFIFWCYYKFNITPNVIYPDVDTMEEFLLMQGAVRNVHYKLLDGNSVHIEELNLLIKGIEVEHCSVYKNKETKEIIYSKPKNVENYYKLFKSYGYEINFNNKKIYYSGDTREYNIKTELFDEIYYECSQYDIEDFPHIGLTTLASKIDLKHRNKVYLMHLDNCNLISKAKDLGFNVVEVEEEKKDIIFSRKIVKVKGKVTNKGRVNLTINSDN